MRLKVRGSAYQGTCADVAGMILSALLLSNSPLLASDAPAYPFIGDFGLRETPRAVPPARAEQDFGGQASAAPGAADEPVFAQTRPERLRGNAMREFEALADHMSCHADRRTEANGALVCSDDIRGVPYRIIVVPHGNSGIRYVELDTDGTMIPPEGGGSPWVPTFNPFLSRYFSTLDAGMVEISLAYRNPTEVGGIYAEFPPFRDGRVFIRLRAAR